MIVRIRRFQCTLGLRKLILGVLEFMFVILEEGVKLTIAGLNSLIFGPYMREVIDLGLFIDLNLLLKLKVFILEEFEGLLRRLITFNFE